MEGMIRDRRKEGGECKIRIKVLFGTWRNCRHAKLELTAPRLNTLTLFTSDNKLTFSLRAHREVHSLPT